MRDAGLLTVADVARRLGVKPATIYAYVSRGLLPRHPASTHRHSLFATSEVERLAHRARAQNRSDALEVVVETQLTALDPAGRLYYRGRNAVELARYRSIESVAVLLWGGSIPTPWEAGESQRELMAMVNSQLTASPDLVDLIPLAVATLAVVDAARGDRRPDAVRRTGSRILGGVLELLTGGLELVDRSAAARLWAALDTEARHPSPAQLASMNAALVLVADHELAASTLAARVAASAWADPYRVVLAGLGPLGGTLHGRAPSAVQALLAGVGGPDEAYTVVDDAAAAGWAPGFGHRVYRDRDPRADHLLERLQSLGTDRMRVQIVDAVLNAAASLGLPAPNVDFALAALAYTLRLRPGASTVMFSFARIIGIVAHAIEEYPHRLRFRPRASYVGEAPHRSAEPIGFSGA